MFTLFPVVNFLNVVLQKSSCFQLFLLRRVNVSVSIHIAHQQADPLPLMRCMGALVPREQQCLCKAPKNSFGGARIADRVRKPVPGGRASSGMQNFIAIGFSFFCSPRA